MIVKLNEINLIEAADWLAGQDTALALILEKYGPPPLWSRTPGFPTLVHMILEQQVSLASANATFAKLQARVEQLDPAGLLQLGEDALREIGFSRQKIAYTRALADTLIAGNLDLDALEHLPDEEVRSALTRLKGIGDWTADIYLSECLLRTDILPPGDIAMQEAFRVLKGLEKRPVHVDFVAATTHWRPWRSVGARMLWHFYLCERGRGTVPA